MKSVHAKRLLKLADFLDTVPRRRFDFADWCSGSDLNECGTTACALGWATAIPAFRKLGARLSPQGLPALRDSTRLQPSEVSERLFGISYDQHRYLFVFGLPDTATPKQAAKHIRTFVARERSTPKGSAER